MTQQTSKGITYPESSDHTRLWEHLQTLADDVDELLDPPEWQSYTPTISNLTIGNGSVIARWRQVGARVNVAWTVQWGSTTTGNMPQLSLPVTPAGLGGMWWTGNCTINPGAGSWRAGWAVLSDGGSTLSTYALTSTATITSSVSTAGITMAAGGWVQGHLEYEAAS